VSSFSKEEAFRKSLLEMSEKMGLWFPTGTSGRTRGKHAGLGFMSWPSWIEKVGDRSLGQHRGARGPLSAHNQGSPPLSWETLELVGFSIPENQKL
jgi:hypothetical protein